jgi:sporulation protein YlmC with PRC-barrel domain
MEELREDSLSALSRDDPAMLAALREAQELEGKDVYDVNGERIGRITRCFGEEGALVKCDVTLTNRARDEFRTPADVAEVPADWIARVEEEAVRLRKSGDELLHPERLPPPNEGAKELPRKIR